MRPLILALGLLISGCFSTPSEAPVEETAPLSPAAKAEVELSAIQARLNAMPMTERDALRRHGPIDPSANRVNCPSRHVSSEMRPLASGLRGGGGFRSATDGDGGGRFSGPEFKHSCRRV